MFEKNGQSLISHIGKKTQMALVSLLEIFYDMIWSGLNLVIYSYKSPFFTDDYRMFTKLASTPVQSKSFSVIVCVFMFVCLFPPVAGGKKM